jgi:MSHA biogenesis protein MshK
MDESLNAVAKNRAIHAGLLLSIFSVSPCIAAEFLPDPTRPPASLGLVQEGNTQALPSGPVLQSVLISPGRKMAIISGQMVMVGGKFGDAKIVNITEGQVTLSSGNNVHTLKLFPNMEKRLTSSQASSQADMRRQ